MTAITTGRRWARDSSSGSTPAIAEKTDPSDKTDDDSEATKISTPETSGAEDERAAAPGPRPRHRVKTYGYQWEWDEAAKDYVHTLQDGRQLLYTVYQRARGDIALCLGLQARSAQRLPPISSSSDGGSDESESDEAASRERENWRAARREWAKLSQQREKIAQANHQNQASGGPLVVSSDLTLNQPAPPPPPPTPPHIRSPAPEQVRRHFEETLDDRFSVVRQPKRFFTVGRIFKTVWFEPYGDDAPARRADLDWTDQCEPFYGIRPLAKFRWFVVVRKRLNHSLCFSITTFGGPGSEAKTRRGRAVDFVVLHSAGIDPPKPFDEEQITRDPLGMIIEEGDQFISPYARLDCSRIYTVEDNLEVMKIGRIHADSLPVLEEYFNEAVK